MTVFCYINSISMSFVCLPFTYIFLTFLIFPQAITMHRTILKISNKILIAILEKSMSMRFIIGKITKIFRLIWIKDKPLAIFMIKTKPSLIDSIFGNHYTHSMFKSMFNSTKIFFILMKNFLIIILFY